jgi:iron(III) transport system permease protein
MLTLLPLVTLVMGSLMVRSGFFATTPLWTFAHWEFVFNDPLFLKSAGTTLLLAVVAGVTAPILFSMLAYLIVRTRLKGRALLDSIIWIGAGIPGILSGLGLLLIFLSAPGLSFLYGSIWALILVMVISGNTTGTNVFKGVFVQLGLDVEEAARVAGANWLRTYFTVVVPLLMPTMVLIGVLNFASAANAVSSIVLLASRETTTLSLLILEYAAPEIGRREAAGIVSLMIMCMTLGVAIVARSVAQRIGVQHGIAALGSPLKRGAM